MSGMMWKQLRWVKRVAVPPVPDDTLARSPRPTTRERLVAALADRPRTVAQLAETFDLAPPTVLEHIRRALRDGLIVEVAVPAAARRFVAERYYAPAVPVIRQPDQELLQSACRAVADEIGQALARSQGDLRAAFAMTTLARDGWRFEALWPYLRETIDRLALQRVTGLPALAAPASHGLTWVEDLAPFAVPPGDDEPNREEESA